MQNHEARRTLWRSLCWLLRKDNGAVTVPHEAVCEKDTRASLFLDQRRSLSLPPPKATTTTQMCVYLSLSLSWALPSTTSATTQPPPKKRSLIAVPLRRRRYRRHGGPRRARQGQRRRQHGVRDGAHGVNPVEVGVLVFPALRSALLAAASEVPVHDQPPG